jgi:hypothetical protein
VDECLAAGVDQIAVVMRARRQPDGGWLYVIDHPYSGSEPDERDAVAPRDLGGQPGATAVGPPIRVDADGPAGFSS